MRILYIEPFEAGAHARFTRVLTAGLEAHWTRITMPGRHWKWRMRGSAVFAALDRADVLAAEHDLVFASSFTPLAELVGLCPRLARIPRVLYFHENQLAYPAKDGEGDPRDHHFGFTQMVSALAATTCVFNSRYNLDSFVGHAAALLRRMPDAVPRGWVERITARARVLPVPLELPEQPPALATDPDPDRDLGPIILWNHRWEHDKNPAEFFGALRELAAGGVPYRVIVCGERYRRAPEVFEASRTWLGSRLIHFGYAASQADYEGLLARAHIVVSTAVHEFFGIAVLEAVHAGAQPVVPDRLVYPEHFAPADRYSDQTALVQRLRDLCLAYCAGRTELRADRRHLTQRYAAATVVPAYRTLFESLVAESRGA